MANAISASTSSCETEKILIKNPSKVKSSVWEHFRFYSMNGQTIAQDMKHKVVCVHCKMEISYPGNTTNLSDHLNRRHSTISLHGEGVAKARGQKRLTDFMQQRREKWNRSSAESQAMDHDIASWIAEDGLPLYLLQKSGFKKFMAKRFPQYDICSRTHLLSLIDKLYEERRGTFSQNSLKYPASLSQRIYGRQWPMILIFLSRPTSFP